MARMRHGTSGGGSSARYNPGWAYTDDPSYAEMRARDEHARALEAAQPANMIPVINAVFASFASLAALGDRPDAVDAAALAAHLGTLSESHRRLLEAVAVLKRSVRRTNYELLAKRCEAALERYGDRRR